MKSLDEFVKKKRYLICVDSDGCAMDTMDSKHHQAFCPQLIRVYGLEEYAGLITPHWMEVNLYSRTRGVNRFKGLAATMRMLAEHGVRVPGADELCAWVEKAPKLSNPALEEAVAAGGGAGLQKAWEWSRAVNAAIAAMAALYFVQGTVGMLALVGLIGFACSSIFSVIYSTALKCHPEKANEISGLMITGVCGGAVIPPLMGFTTDLLGSQTGSLLVIAACMLYLAGCALALRRFAAK